jgi:hypothetical protein
MKDSKVMNLNDGSANDIIKHVITARNEKLAKDHEIRGSLRNFSQES